MCYWCWAPKGLNSVIYRKDWASAVSAQPVPVRDESPEATHCSRPQSRSSIPKKLIPKLIMIGFFPSLSPPACSSEWCRERTLEKNRNLYFFFFFASGQSKRMNLPHNSCQRGGFRNVWTIMQSERRADLAGAKCNLFGPFCAAAPPRHLELREI